MAAFPVGDPLAVGLCVSTVVHAVPVWAGPLGLGFGGLPAAPATAVKPNSETPQTAAVAIILFITSISS